MTYPPYFSRMCLSVILCACNARRKPSNDKISFSQDTPKTKAGREPLCGLYGHAANAKDKILGFFTYQPFKPTEVAVGRRVRLHKPGGGNVPVVRKLILPF